jgi:hypothetical protein
MFLLIFRHFQKSLLKDNHKKLRFRTRKPSLVLPCGNAKPLTFTLSFEYGHCIQHLLFNANNTIFINLKQNAHFETLIPIITSLVSKYISCSKIKSVAETRI